MIVALSGCQIDTVRGTVVRQDGATVQLSSIETALLEYLHANAGRPLSRETLLREVWGYSDTVVSRAADAAIARLRTKIEAVPATPVHLRTVFGTGYRFDPEPAEVLEAPAAETSTLVLGARTVDLHRGRLDDGTTLTARETTLLRLLAEHRSMSREQLATDVLGKPDAIKALATAIYRLRKKVEPDPANPTLLVTTATGYALAEAAPSSLPNPTPTFVGRRSELAALARSDARLLTLVGPGGMGKTQLALRFAHSVEDACWVDVSEASSVDDLGHALIRALGLGGGMGAGVDRLAVALEARAPGLVVLDDFDALVPHGSFLGELTRRAPAARFLVTSRSVLGVEGEQIFELGPLDVDAAVALFGKTSRTPADEAEVTALVDALDRIPLAVRLAAGRTAVLSPGQLLEHLDLHVLQDRTTSMQATLQLSWDGLVDDERVALRRLAVFRGGFELEAASHVLERDLLATLEVVQGLRDKSLLTDLSTGSRPRLGMYALVRSFVRVDPGAADRHAAWFARYGSPTFLERIKGPRWWEPEAQLERELDNLVAARDHATSCGDAATACALVLATSADHERRGSTDFASLNAVLALPHSPCDRARLLTARAFQEKLVGDFAAAEATLEQAQDTGAADATTVALHAHVVYRQGRFDDVRALCDRGLALEGDRESEETLLALLGSLDVHEGRWEAGRDKLRAALDILRPLGGRRVAGALLNLAWVSFTTDSPAAAVAYEREAVAVLGDHPDAYLGFRALLNLSWSLYVIGELDEARTLAERGRRLGRTQGYVEGEVRGTQQLAMFWASDDPDRAAGLLARTEALARSAKTDTPPWAIRGTAGHVLLRAGRIAEALPVVQQAIAGVREVGYLEIAMPMLLDLAECCIALGRIDEAKAALDEVAGFTIAPNYLLEVRILRGESDASELVEAARRLGFRPASDLHRRIRVVSGHS